MFILSTATVSLPVFKPSMHWTRLDGALCTEVMTLVSDNNDVPHQLRPPIEPRRISCTARSTVYVLHHRDATHSQHKSLYHRGTPPHDHKCSSQLSTHNACPLVCPWCGCCRSMVQALPLAPSYSNKPTHPIHLNPTPPIRHKHLAFAWLPFLLRNPSCTHHCSPNKILDGPLDSLYLR
jgi:hypothetical protein